MPKTTESLEAIILKLQDARADLEKFDAGKKGAPGTRARKVALDATRALNDLRKEILAARKDESGA
jgi:hypothetical protein